VGARSCLLVAAAGPGQARSSSSPSPPGWPARPAPV